MEEIDARMVGCRHAAVLSALHAQSFTGQDDQRWTPAAFVEILSIPGTLAMLAVRKNGSGNDEPLGFAILGTAADQGEIISFGVVPSAQRHRVGAFLLDRVLVQAVAVGVVRIFLEVAEDNSGARAFYQVHGFVQSGRRENYYRRGRGKCVHARILCKELVPSR